MISLTLKSSKNYFRRDENEKKFVTTLETYIFHMRHRIFFTNMIPKILPARGCNLVVATIKSLFYVNWWMQSFTV